MLKLKYKDKVSTHSKNIPFKIGDLSIKLFFLPSNVVDYPFYKKKLIKREKYIH